MKLRFVIVAVAATSGWLAFASDFARGQEIPQLLHHMAGKWDVTERMWPGPSAAPIALPAAIAERRLVGDSLLEDRMIAVRGSNPSFTRIADLNYNVVTHQFEYFSWDSRAPQMMIEKSRSDVAMSGGIGQSAIKLYGGIFMAPIWGKMKNVAFRYRLSVGQIQHDRQVVQLYFTPLSGSSPKEFLAFEYVYEKQL